MTALEHLSDAELLQSLDAADAQAAFDQLVERHRRLVFGVAYGYTRELKAARTVTERVFLRLSREADVMRGRISLEDWLRRATGDEYQSSV